MADIHDVAATDQEVERQLRLLEEERDIANILCISTAVIVAAIQALGVRLDYVLREVENKHRSHPFK